MRLLLLSLLFAAHGPVAPQGAQDPTRSRDLAIEASSPVPPEILREELFFLEQCDSDPTDAASFLRAPCAERRFTGLASWRRKRDAQGLRVEWEIVFPFDDTRVLHVERLVPGGSKLVWREIRPGEGRTLMASWDEDARGLDLLEWSGPHRSRERIDAQDGAVLPLYLLELARSGDVEDGRFPLFDPLARAIEPVRIAVRYVGAPETCDADTDDVARFEVQRLVELVRDDGTRAGLYLFSGEELLAFQWQSGALRARRVTADAYASKLAEFAPPQPQR